MRGTTNNRLEYTSWGGEGAVESVSEETSDGCDGEADGEMYVPVGWLGFAVLD
jgi:hypothetical protein